MKAKSIRGSSTEEIREALEKELEDGFQPSLAVIFLNVNLIFLYVYFIYELFIF